MKLAAADTERQGLKLLVDLDAVDAEAPCEGRRVPCSYYYHPADDGYAVLREKAVFAVFCRHCEQAVCIKACPTEALERADDGIVRRSSMQCVKCNSCVIACPFGTIQEAMIPYATSQCDFCLGRVDPGEAPRCVEAGASQVVKYGPFAPDAEAGIFALNEAVLVRSKTWKRSGDT